MSAADRFFQSLENRQLFSGNAPVPVADHYLVTAGQALDVSIARGPLANDIDPEGDALNVYTFVNPSHAKNFSINQAGFFHYEPANGFVGTDSFTYSIQESASPSTPSAKFATVTINVLPAANRAPIVCDDEYTVSMNGTLTVNGQKGAWANDRDLDGDAVAWAITSNPVYGTFTPNPDGSFTYKPMQNFAGYDSFKYRLSDMKGLSEEATVRLHVSDYTITPTPANDNFVITRGQPFHVLSYFGLLANDHDPQNLPVYTDTFNTNNHGALSVNYDGALSYTPDADFTGTIQFGYTIKNQNGQAARDYALVTITVVDPNRAPAAEADEYAVKAGQTLTVGATSGILANDLDLDGEALHLVGITNLPQHGQIITSAADGSFSYRPSAGFVGADTFDVTIADATGATTSSTVTVNVYGPPPTASGSFEFESAQRIKVTFSDDVTLPPGGVITLSNLDSGQVLPVMVNGLNGRVATLSVPDGIPDGNWRLTVGGSAVLSQFGQALDGNGDGVGEDAYAFDFFALTGDANHDRAVDTLDFNALAGNFGKSGRTFSQGDFNYDGAVDTLDFNALAGRFGYSLTAPAAPRSAPALFSTAPIASVDLLDVIA